MVASARAGADFNLLRENRVRIHARAFCFDLIAGLDVAESDRAIVLPDARVRIGVDDDIA